MLDPKNFNMHVFEKKGQESNSLSKLYRFLFDGHVFDVNQLMASIRENVGDLTFQVQPSNHTQSDIILKGSIQQDKTYPQYHRFYLNHVWNAKITQLPDCT